ncbi:MAG TPA: hypothetical protein VF509_00490 [Sphingobium sp.]
MSDANDASSSQGRQFMAQHEQALERLQKVKLSFFDPVFPDDFLNSIVRVTERGINVSEPR